MTGKQDLQDYLKHRLHYGKNHTSIDVNEGHLRRFEQKQALFIVFIIIVLDEAHNHFSNPYDWIHSREADAMKFSTAAETR